jgi:S1-C subfamily serine protease
MTEDLEAFDPPEISPQQNRKLHFRVWGKKIIPFFMGVLVTLFMFILYNGFRSEPDQIEPGDVEAIVASALASSTPPPAISAQVYQLILPSLVLIETKSTDNEGKNGFGIGSGVIINSNAAILTALHVVDGATDILVDFADGTQSRAIVVSEQPENDIAVLLPETPPSEFLPAVIGSAGAMRIGDDVFAVGNPLGLAGSMSAGVISGFERSFMPVGSDIRLEGLIQFDAAVNPGNSGGPLLNRYGQVVGIVTGLVNPTEQEVFIGIGFAVPINVAAGAAGGPAQ